MTGNAMPVILDLNTQTLCMYVNLFLNIVRFSHFCEKVWKTCKSLLMGMHHMNKSKCE